MLSIVVAKAKNNMIGKDNKQLWFLPNVLKRFNNLTNGHVVIMGRKTFESLGAALPNRKNVVFTNNLDYVVNDPNVEVVHSMLEIKQYIDDENENFVIGGAMIFNLLMPHVKKMYVTELYQDFDGDAFFPRIDSEVWNEVERVKFDADLENSLAHDFVIYERK